MLFRLYCEALPRQELYFTQVCQLVGSFRLLWLSLSSFTINRLEINPMIKIFSCPDLVGSKQILVGSKHFQETYFFYFRKCLTTATLFLLLLGLLCACSVLTWSLFCEAAAKKIPGLTIANEEPRNESRPRTTIVLI